MREPDCAAGSEAVYAGMAVSKKWIELKTSSSEHVARIAYTAQGMAEALARLHLEMPALIALEASGGLELRLSVELIAAGFTIVIADPRQVRDYALARNLLKWGERGDAVALASFALALSSRRPTIKPEDAQALRDMRDRQRQLGEMRDQEILRLEQASPAQRRSLLHHLAWLDKCLGELDSDMLRRLRASDVWRVRENLLRGIAGANVLCFPTSMRRAGVIMETLP